MGFGGSAEIGDDAFIGADKDFARFMIDGNTQDIIGKERRITLTK